MPQSLNREVMGIAADARDADPFSFQLLRPFDIGFGDDAMGQQAFDPAYKHRVSVSLHERPANARRTDLSDFAIAGKNRRHRRGARSDEDQRASKSYFLNSPAS